MPLEELQGAFPGITGNLGMIVGALVVEEVPKLIEAALLCAHVVGWRVGRMRFQCAVHALVTPVLFRMSRLDALRDNAEAHPPNAELAEAANRG